MSRMGKRPVAGGSAGSDPVLVVGGGLGGVAMALGLARHGRSSILVEAARQLGEIGAGIQLAPNAFDALDALGVADPIRHDAVLVESFRLMDALGGDEIASFSLADDFRTRFGNPYAVVHRGDLHSAMLNACEESGLVKVRTGHRVSGYTNRDRQITLHVEGREPLSGPLLVGADGIRSTIRSQMLADGTPRVSGHTTYRSVIPTEQMPEPMRWNAMTIWVGEKLHIVHYPLKGWKAFNLVATRHDHAGEAVSGESVETDRVRALFADVAPAVRNVIESGEGWKKWMLCDRDPGLRWSDGRAVLLGDAAHPTLQYFAQGACMAIEDAVCLSRLIAEVDDPAEALAPYAAARQERTARVQIGSRLIGDHIFHPGGAGAVVRNRLLGGIGNESFYDFMAWLFEHRSLAA